MNQAVNLIDLINEENNNLNQATTNQFEENTISELQMHKILYLLFGEFYLEFNKNLFDQPNFEAWKLGPVEIDFRKGFKENKIENIKKFNLFLNYKEILFLKELIKKLLRHSAWYLVDITHTSNAWIDNYDGKEGSRNKISEKDIKEKF